MNVGASLEADTWRAGGLDVLTWQRANVSSVSDTFLRRVRGALRRQRSIVRSPNGWSDRVLRDILGQAEETYFGRKHGIARVRTLRDWKKAVPVRRYDDFLPYIEKIVDGDLRVLTRSEPYALLRTSGSSGRPKLIPTTRHWRDRYRGRALYAQWGLYFERIGFDRARGSAVLDLSWERSTASPTVGALPRYSISQRPAAVSTTDWLPPWYGENWFQSVAGECHKSSLYRKLRLLAASDVRIVTAINPSKILSLADVLTERAGDLIADLRNGTLEGQPCHDGKDVDLAARLERLRRESGGTLRLKDLWPELSLVVAWNSASAALYWPWLDEATRGVSKLPFSSTGTEGIVTMPVDDHGSAGPLAVDLGVYEFAPVAERDGGTHLKPDVETVDYHEVEVGQTYHVVISQANGLYRYDLGDRYTVVDWVGGVPRLEFCGRTGFVGSFTGEKLTEEDVYHAVRLALGSAWRGRPLFSCVPVWAMPPGYTLVVESPVPLGIGVDELAVRVDTELQKLNVEYAEKRRTGRLTPIEVFRVPPGSFAAVEERRRRDGAAPAQAKHHWIQRNSDFLEDLKDAGRTGA